MGTVSKLQERLKKRLAAEGFIVDFFVITTGWWRTSPQADCYRWEAWGTHPDFPDSPNLRLNLGSYDTMTDCARYGFKFLKDERFHWEVFANLPSRQKPVDTPPTI